MNKTPIDITEETRMNAEAFRHLVGSLYGMMLATATRITGSEEDGADVVQEALIKLWEQRERLANATNRKGYVIGTVRNAGIDYLRRKQPTEPIENVSASASEMADSRIEQSEKAGRIRKLLEKLSDNQRKAVEMRDLDGMEMDEIGTVMGMSAENVRVVLCRGRQTLRRLLGNRERWE